MLGWIFRSKSAPRPPTAPPAPQGDWRIIVDAWGEPVRDRAPTAGDYLARPAMSYSYGGTKPAYDRALHGHAPSNYLKFKMEDEHNSKNLERAVFILSQTNDGRRLLRMARDKGFTFEFDRVGTEARGAAGYCDYANKKIPLHPEATAEGMALTLKHELQHMADIASGITSSASDPINKQVETGRVLEASARTSEAVLVYETEFPPPDAPAKVWKPAGLAAAFRNKLPHMADAAQKAGEHAKQKKWGEFFAAVMPAYAMETKSLTFYDNDYIKSIRKILPADLETIEAKKASPYARHHTPSLESYGPTLRKLTASEKVNFAGLCARVDCCGQRINDPTLAEKLQKTFCGLTDGARDAYQELKTLVHAMWPNDQPPPDMDIQAYAAPATTTRRSFREILGIKPRAKKTPPTQSSVPQKTPVPVEAYIAPHLTDTSYIPSEKPKEDIKKDYASCFDSNAARVLSHGAYDLDRIYFSIQLYAQNYGGEKRAAAELINAGLRAPIAAFPEGFINHLSLKIKGLGKDPSKHPWHQLRKEEVAIIEHWQNLAKAGISPLDGGLKGERALDENWFAVRFAKDFDSFLKTAPVSGTTHNAQISQTQIEMSKSGNPVASPYHAMHKKGPNTLIGSKPAG